MSAGRRSPSKSTRRQPVILFSIGPHAFAVAAGAVQEIRSTDSLGGAATEIEPPGVEKVRHTLERAGRTYFVVSGSVHYGLARTRPTMVLVLRQPRVAVLVDSIERMAEIPGVVALPHSFEGEERRWYRGLAYLDGRVVPVVNPEGFLNEAELQQLESCLGEMVPSGVEGATSR